MVVRSGVAEQDDARLRADLLAPALPEDAEGVPVVGVAVDPDDVGLLVDAVDGLADGLRAVEDRRHLVDAVDEDETPHLRELRSDRVHEVQREAGEGGHRPGDVGDDEISGLAGFGWRKRGSAGTPP